MRSVSAVWGTSDLCHGVPCFLHSHSTLASLPTPPHPTTPPHPSAIIAADTIKCGVRNDLPGFSSTNEAGDHVGFDSDFCRVLAAGILGDSTKVTFVDVDTDDKMQIVIEEIKQDKIFLDTSLNLRITGASTEAGGPLDFDPTVL